MKELLTAILVLPCLAGLVAADDSPANFAFFYRLSNPPTLNPVTPLSTVMFPDTAIGATTAVTFLIQTTQTTTNGYSIVSPSVTGPGFSLADQNGAVPAQANGFGAITINLTPTTGDFSNGSLQFDLRGQTGLTFHFVFSLFGRVTSARGVTTYTLPPDNNQVTINSGDTIPFPNTPVSASTQAAITVTNTGTASVTVDSVSLSGDGYRLGNLPLLPAAVAAGGNLRFAITFSPTAARRYQGTLSISLGGTLGTYSLDGQGASALFSYRVLSGSEATSVIPGSTITLPDTPADGNAKSTVTIQVTNAGNAEGTIQNIGVTGSDFQLANVPPVPRTVGPTGFTSFDLVYQPARPGPSSGRLQVGNDVFPLAGNGLGGMLSATADVGTGSVAVPNRGTVAVPNTAVGLRRSVFLTVTNTGNQPATLSSVSVGGPVFNLGSLPALPVALQPGGSQRIEIRFAPVNTGAASATVTVNDQSFTLIGSGDQPAALPAVSILGLAAQTDPLEQPALSLQLASPYPADLRGVLTIAFLSDTFADDPAIQFANGSRQVNFTVPANTTDAVFDQLGRSAAFQTGTVSGNLIVSARFTVGSVDVTPNTAPSVTTVIPTGPPQLSAIRLGSQNGNTLQLLISGYSPSRSVNQLALRFTGVTGSNLQTTSQTVDVASAFTNWYAEPGSRAFGSQFTLTLTLTVTGDVNALQTVAVTASNAQGSSASRSVALR